MRAEDVEWVECAITPLAGDSLIHDRPRSGLEAKFSAPYSVAAALLHDEDPGNSLPTKRCREPIPGLVQRLTVVVDPGIEAPKTGEWRGLGTRLTVKLRDGRACTNVVAITGNEDATTLPGDDHRQVHGMCTDGAW